MPYGMLFVRRLHCGSTLLDVRSYIKQVSVVGNIFPFHSAAPVTKISSYSRDAEMLANVVAAVHPHAPLDVS